MIIFFHRKITSQAPFISCCSGDVREGTPCSSAHTCGDHHANNGEDPQQNRTNHLNDAGTSGTAKENETKK